MLNMLLNTDMFDESSDDDDDQNGGRSPPADTGLPVLGKRNHVRAAASVPKVGKSQGGHMSYFQSMNGPLNTYATTLQGTMTSPNSSFTLGPSGAEGSPSFRRPSNPAAHTTAAGPTERGSLYHPAPPESRRADANGDYRPAAARGRYLESFRYARSAPSFMVARPQSGGGAAQDNAANDKANVNNLNTSVSSSGSFAHLMRKATVYPRNWANQLRHRRAAAGGNGDEDGGGEGEDSEGGGVAVLNGETAEERLERKLQAVNSDDEDYDVYGFDLRGLESSSSSSDGEGGGGTGNGRAGEDSDDSDRDGSDDDGEGEDNNEFSDDDDEDDDRYRAGRSFFAISMATGDAAASMNGKPRKTARKKVINHADDSVQLDQVQNDDNAYQNIQQPLIPAPPPQPPQERTRYNRRHSSTRRYRQTITPYKVHLLLGFDPFRDIGVVHSPNWEALELVFPTTEDPASSCDSGSDGTTAASESPEDQEAVPMNRVGSAKGVAAPPLVFPPVTPAYNQQQQQHYMTAPPSVFPPVGSPMRGVAGGAMGMGHPVAHIPNGRVACYSAAIQQRPHNMQMPNVPMYLPM